MKAPRPDMARVQTAVDRMEMRRAIRETSEIMSASTNYLIAEGWREYPDQFRKHARCFFKRLDTPTRCSENDDKPGIQVCIVVYDNGLDGRGESFLIDICAGLPDGSWIKLENYNLPNDVRQVITVIPRLIAAWEFLATFKS